MKTYIFSIPDIDEALLQIGKLKAQIEQNQADAESKINQIKDDAAQKNLPLGKRIQSIEDAIATFVEKNRSEILGDAKSLRLIYGLIGYRKSSSLVIEKAQETIAKIRKFFPRRKGAIIIKESADKNILKQWNDADLKKIGVKRETKDEFFYELNKTEIIQRM